MNIEYQCLIIRKGCFLQSTRQAGFGVRFYFFFPENTIKKSRQNSERRKSKYILISFIEFGGRKKKGWKTIDVKCRKRKGVNKSLEIKESSLRFHLKKKIFKISFELKHIV